MTVANAIAEFDRRIAIRASAAVADRIVAGWPPDVLAEFVTELHREAVACRAQMLADIAALAPTDRPN